MKTMLSMQAVCREGKLSNSDRNYARGGRREGRRIMKRKKMQDKGMEAERGRTK